MLVKCCLKELLIPSPSYSIFTQVFKHVYLHPIIVVLGGLLGFVSLQDNARLNGLRRFLPLVWRDESSSSYISCLLRNFRTKELSCLVIPIFLFLLFFLPLHFYCSMIQSVIDGNLASKGFTITISLMFSTDNNVRFL